MMKTIRMVVLGVGLVSVAKAQTPAQAAEASARAQAAEVNANEALANRRAELSAQLEKMRAQLADLRKKYNANYPDVRAAEGQVRGLESQLRALENLPRVRVNVATPRVATRVKVADGYSYNYGLPSETSTLATIIAKDEGLPRRWWQNEATARRVGIDAGQKQRMDDIFQDYRLKLVDLNGALEKAELILEPLMDAEKLDEGKIASQIDKVANARADLEKARARMALDLRMVLTPEQWRKLNNK